VCVCFLIFAFVILFLEIIFHVYLVYELFTVNKGRLDNIGLSRKKMTGREPVLTR